MTGIKRIYPYMSHIHKDLGPVTWFLFITDMCAILGDNLFSIGARRKTAITMLLSCYAWVICGRCEDR